MTRISSNLVSSERQLRWIQVSTEFLSHFMISMTIRIYTKSLSRFLIVKVTAFYLKVRKNSKSKFKSNSKKNSKSKTMKILKRMIKI